MTAAGCAPRLPLGTAFRWFHAPKTGSSFSATLWYYLCPTTIAPNVATVTHKGAVWPKGGGQDGNDVVSECQEPNQPKVSLQTVLPNGHTPPLYQRSPPLSTHSAAAPAVAAGAGGTSSTAAEAAARQRARDTAWRAAMGQRVQPWDARLADWHHTFSLPPPFPSFGKVCLFCGLCGNMGKAAASGVLRLLSIDRTR